MPVYKIFVLIGLAEPCCRKAISIPYHKKLAQVALEVLAHHLLHHKKSPTIDQQEDEARYPMRDLCRFHRYFSLTWMDFKLELAVESPSHDEAPSTNVDSSSRGKICYLNPSLGEEQPPDPAHISGINAAGFSRYQRFVELTRSVYDPNTVQQLDIVFKTLSLSEKPIRDQLEVDREVLENRARARGP